MNAFYTELISGPQADDIAGMVFIYGPAVVDPPPPPVPAPATMALVGIALLAVALRRRRV